MTVSATLPNKHKSTIYPIQVLRAVAALLVVADHSLVHIFSAYDLPQKYHVMAWQLGGIGVTVFFVISGFVMALTNDGNFGHKDEPLRFMINRIVRILPLYWVMTFVAAALFIVSASKQISFSYLLTSMFFLVPQDATTLQITQPVLGPGWTLSYEMFFYAVFAFFLLLPKRAALAGFTTVMIALVVWGMSSLSSAEINNPTTRFAFYANPLLLLFVGGVWLGSAYKKYENYFQKSQISIVWMFATIILMTGFSWAVDKNSWPLYLQPIVFVLPLICVAVTLCCRFEPVNFTSRFAILLGEASYSIYLSHIIFLAVLRKVVPADLLYGTVYFFAGFIGATITGLIIYKTIEVPLTNYIRKFIKPKPRRKVAVI